MKTLFAFTALAISCWSTPSFQFAPVTDMQTAYSTRIYWSSNAPATATIKYGLTISYGLTTSLGYGSNNKLWVWNITGLQPSTPYHYQVCLNDGSEVCSTDATFTTLAQGSTTPNLPTTVDTAMPINLGTTRTVASDCSDFASIYAASTWGDIIEIPPTATCNSTYTLAAKTHNPGDGWIIIRPTTWASLPAEGVRIQESDEANMFKLVHTGPGVGDWRSGTAIKDTTCDDGNQPGNMMIDWVVRVSPGEWPLLQCAPSATTKSITAASYLTANTATLSITGHGSTVNQTFWISGATSTTGKLAALMNGGGKVTAVIDANTITVQFFRNDSTASTDTYTGSGLIAQNYYSAVAHTSGTVNPTGACTDGSWYFNTATATNEATRATSMFYCGTDLAWHNFNNQNQQVPLLNLRTAKYIRIIGGIFTHLPPMTDPLLNRYGAHHSHVNRYTGMEAFVVESYQTSHVILDRCWIKGHDLSRVNLAMNMHGDNVAFINSRISEWSWWIGTADWDKIVDTESGGIYPQTGPGPGLIHNNYLEVGGITVHFDDSYAQNAPAANNYTVSQNTFYRPSRWFYGHASSNGRMYYHRHLLEWKVGNTIRVVGNLFDGGWRLLNRGEAIMLGFRSGGWYGNCTFVAGTGTCGSPHFLRAGDKVTVDGSSIGLVSAIGGTYPTSTTLTVISVLPDGQHYLNKLNHDTSIYDITVENNIFRNLPNVFAIFGVQDNFNMKGSVSRRIMFRNNLAYDIDQMRHYGELTAGEGSLMNAHVGAEDVTVEHNTFACAVGGTCREPLVGSVQTNGTTLKATGFVARNNLMYVGNWPYYADGSNGTVGLTLQYPNGYTYSSNVLFRAGGNPGLSPTGNFWHNTSTLGAIPFDADYRLTGLYKSSNTCFLVPGDCTTDGADSGADITAVLAAQGGGAPPTALRGPRGNFLIHGNVRLR